MAAPLERIFDTMSGIFHIMSNQAASPRPEEPSMRLSPLLLAAALLALGGSNPAAQAQHGAPAPTEPSGNLQGEDPRKFMDNSQMRAFYDLSVSTLRPGAPPLDLQAY